MLFSFFSTFSFNLSWVPFYFTTYFSLFFFFLISFILSFIFFLLSYLLGTSVKILDREKSSAYECGFEPLKDSRDLYTVQFYRLAVLFIIFDVEILFLLPWVIILKKYINIDPFFYFSGIFFIFPLVMAFIYELYVKALEI